MSPGPSRRYYISARWVRNSGLGGPVHPEEYKITAGVSGLQSRQRKEKLSSDLLSKEHRGSEWQLTGLRYKMLPTVVRMPEVSP